MRTKKVASKSKERLTKSALIKTVYGTKVSPTTGVKLTNLNSAKKMVDG